MTWRSKSAEVLRGLVSQVKHLAPEDARRVISQAYPFGPRSNHPYKIWLDECHRTFPHLYRKTAKQLELPDWLKPKGDA